MKIRYEKELPKNYRTVKKIKTDYLFYKKIVDKASDSILCLDKNGKYLYVNHAYLTLLNREEDSIVGKKISDIYSARQG